jgi:hypothetical protein
MPVVRFALTVALLAGTLAIPPAALAVPPPGSDCPIFPEDNVWHSEVRKLPVHRKSDRWITAMGGRSEQLHPDFGPSDDPDQPYGIPFNIEDNGQAKVEVEFDYADESDPGPYPVDDASWVENGSDLHVLVVQKDECRLYELFDFDWNDGQPLAGSGAVWELQGNQLRPATWTSADAAGLPIFAGLIRRDEVVAGVIDHAIRVTAEETDQKFVWPARHQAGARRDAHLPPMGARFRLKKRFNISRFHPETRVILRAMKRYGLIVADNGSNWFFGGASNGGNDWPDQVLDELKSIRAGAFEAVQSKRLMVNPGSARAKQNR